MADASFERGSQPRCPCRCSHCPSPKPNHPGFLILFTVIIVPFFLVVLSVRLFIAILGLYRLRIVLLATLCAAAGYGAH